eukprot:963922-Rhodomonas_salina.7
MLRKHNSRLVNYLLIVGAYRNSIPVPVLEQVYLHAYASVETRVYADAYAATRALIRADRGAGIEGEGGEASTEGATGATGTNSAISLRAQYKMP